MTERDTLLHQARPQVPTGSFPDDTPAGRFLHQSLRPVLKLQNPLLLACLRQHLHDHRLALGPLDEQARREAIDRQVRQHAPLKHALIGLVTGLLTAGEYAFYLAHRSEINRRLVALLTQRFHTQTEQLT